MHNYQKLVKIVLAVLLLMSLLPWEGKLGVYYEFIRFTATAGFAVLAYISKQKREEGLMVSYIILAVLFNPFLMVRLGRPLWNVVDVSLAIWLLYPLWGDRKKDEPLVSTNAVLPRLIVDDAYKIILADNRIEIVLTPLPKALYLLYLNHPEGIAFKDLIDYKEELLSIYHKIELSEDDAKMLQSVNELVNPLSNSVNEKAYRIKEAFCKHLPDDLAQNYYLTGDRGGVKRVKWNGFY